MHTAIISCFPRVGYCAVLLSGGLIILHTDISHLAQEGKVLRSVAFMDTAVVLAKGDVQNPMELVLNGPVSPSIGESLLRTGLKAGDIVGFFKGLLPFQIASALYHDKGTQA